MREVTAGVAEVEGGGAVRGDVRSLAQALLSEMEPWQACQCGAMWSD